MLTIPISPIIFRLGQFQLTYYSLTYVFGFLLMLYVLLKASKKKEINLTENQIYDFVILEFIFVTLFARLFHVIFWNNGYYSADPIKILYVWQGGLSFHGGLVGAIIAGIIFLRNKPVKFFELADLLILPFAFVHGLQRISNFINQEIVGLVSSVPWCFKFEYYKGCRHPVQLYAAAGRFALFFFLLFIKKTKAFKPGFLFWIFIFFSGLGRFVLDFLREDVRYVYLSAGQWFSLVMIIIGAYILLSRYKKELISVFSF